MSADRLREASTRLREMADGAGVGNWRTGDHPMDEAKIYGDDMEIYDEGGHTAEQAIYIAMMQPTVALALAEWLAKYADLIDNSRHVNRPAFGDLTHALAVADAILGEPR